MTENTKTITEPTKEEIKEARKKVMHDAVRLDNVVRSSKLNRNETAVVLHAADQLRSIYRTNLLYVDGKLNHSYRQGEVVKSFNAKLNKEETGLIIGTYLGNASKNGSKPIRHKVQIIDSDGDLLTRESDWNIDSVY